MAWEKQTKNDLYFVDWGELKENHNPDENIVVEEGCAVEGMVDRVKPNENYGYTYLLGNTKVIDKKEETIEEPDKQLLIKGNKSLNRQMMEDDADDFIPVKEGDEVRVWYTGEYTTEKGGTGYSMVVEVKR